MAMWTPLGGFYGDSEYLDTPTGLATIEWSQTGGSYEVRVFDYRTDTEAVIRLFPEKRAGKAWAEAQLA
jgi:hypothetical protein